MQPKLTSEQYVEARGQICPFCESSRISGYTPQVEGTEAW